MAEKADKHELYELSVQDVENEVIFLQDTFKEVRGREAHLLREDFCGTASACCQWVKQGEAFQAIGVDIDPLYCNGDAIIASENSIPWIGREFDWSSPMS